VESAKRPLPQLSRRAVFRAWGPEDAFSKYLKASGITKKISPHSLRHSFATYKAERGVGSYVLREWLGHAQLDTTQTYVHMAQENTKKAMEATSL
jgi:integrase/recombinase XerD